MGRLSRREVEVLAEVAAGRTYVEAAARLGISETGVKSHMTRIFQKLNVVNNVQAVVVAIALGLIAVSCTGEEVVATPTPEPSGAYDHTPDVWMMQAQLDAMAKDVDALTRIANGTGERLVYEEPIGDTLLLAWLNQSTAEGLDALPGVGPATAASLQAARPFGSLADVLAIPGIGQATLMAMRTLVCPADGGCADLAE